MCNKKNLSQNRANVNDNLLDKFFIKPPH